jgi:hypothetical protein
MKNIMMEDWLLEYDIPAAAAQGDPIGGSAMTDPTQGTGAQDPNITNPQQDMAPDPQQQEPDDASQDPQAPDMPEPQKEVDDFEVWKNNYFKESIKGEANALIDFMVPMRERDTLQPYQRKFVDDNWNIQLLRQNANVERASKEIRKLIKDQLDRNNPGRNVTDHISRVLETYPMLSQKLIQILGYGSYKGELHRKFLAALMGAVQVNSSYNQANIIYNDEEYSIEICTRFNAEWGDVPLGSWSLKEDDPERYLSAPELKRLQEGSPEEKETLRRRLVVESICDQFKRRAYIINTVGDDGTIYAIGWDLANSLRSAYTEGKLVVRTKHSDNSEAMINDAGEIVPLIDLKIHFIKDTGELEDDGQSHTEESEFIERREGMLFLNAGLQTIRDASTTLGQGIIFKEAPYQGNPSDLKTLRRCVYSVSDLLLRTC